VYVLDHGPLRQHIQKEINYPGRVSKGNRGSKVKRIQEWLCLNHRKIVPDGDFGPVTRDALKQFQEDSGLPVTGNVNRETFDCLIAPMTSALSNQIDMSIPFGEAVLAFANAHLAMHPREVGGDNRGPWVRLYMDGHDGSSWLWCAGFVRFCMRQAAEALQVSMPIRGSGSCDLLATQGKDAGIFLTGSRATSDQITPGSIFLVRKTAADWTHTGFVSDANEDRFVTIEGNTNDDGVRNGYEVCERRRGYKKKDFIVFD